MIDHRKVSDLKRKNIELARYELTHNISRVKSFPSTIGISVNETCNVRCIFCYSTVRSDANIDWSHLSGLSSIFPYVNEVILSGEEVILHPDIKEMFEAFIRQGIFVNFFTNGKALTPDVMEWLVDQGVGHISCSFHGATKGTYNSIVRGADFETTVEQFHHLKRYRLKREKECGRRFGPGITFHYVMLRRNVEELPRFLEIASEVMADRVIAKYMMVYENLKHLSNESLYFYQDLTNRVISQCEEKARHLPILFGSPLKFSSQSGEENDSPGKGNSSLCHWPWMQCNIDIQGNVKPCCGRLAAIGNIHESTFEEIWNSEKYVDLRSTVNTQERWPECQRCNYLTNTVDNNDIYSHLPYLQDHVGVRPQFTPLASNGRFTLDESLLEQIWKTYKDSKQGDPGTVENVRRLLDMVPEKEKDYLMRQLEGSVHFDSNLFFLVMIRFLNRNSRSYAAYRLIKAWAADTRTSRHLDTSHGWQILVENFLSEINVGFYRNAGDSLVNLKGIIGESNHTFVRDLMNGLEWSSIRSRLNDYLDMTLSTLILNSPHSAMLNSANA